MGKGGKREYVQVLRLLETFRLEDVHAAVREALAAGRDRLRCRQAPGAVPDRAPPAKLDLTLYPYLPRLRSRPPGKGLHGAAGAGLVHE